MNKIPWMLAAMVWIMTANAAAQTVAFDTAVMKPNDTANTLNFLIEKAVESGKGYEEAADRVTYAGLKVRFLITSIQREKFAKELQKIVKHLKASEEIFTNVPYSPWFGGGDVRTHDDKDVLKALKPREENILAAYQEALDKNLPQDIREVVQKQAKKVESLYKWIAKNTPGK